MWRAADGAKPDHTYLTPKEAQDTLDVLLAAERAKPSNAPRVSGRTFGDAAAEWLTHSEGVRGVAPTTLAGYRTMVRVLHNEEWPETLQLRRISPRRVESYQERLLAEGRLGRDSVRQRMLVLRGVLARARELGWVAINPAADVKIVAQPRTNPDFNVLEPSQVEAVAEAIAAVSNDDLPRMRNGVVDERSLEVMRERRRLYAEAVRLAAYSGLRFGELRALQWRDVNRAGESILVRRSAPADAPVKAPKSGRGRSVPLIAPALAALDRLAAAGYSTQPDDLILPTRTGGMLESGRVRDAFYRGLAAAGLGHLREKDNPMTFHDLRHTFGTLAVRKLPVTDVQEYMGHSDIQTTMRYVHHVPRTDAARRLSEAFASDLTPGSQDERAADDAAA